MKEYRILIIDDDREIINPVMKYLKNKNYKVVSASTGKEGIRKFEILDIDIILLDLNLPDINGIEVAKEIRKINKEVIIIVITAYGSVESAVQLFKLGINDYILKPFQLEELYFIIDRLIKNKETAEENILLKKEIHHIYKPENLIGESKKMQEVYKQIIKIAQYDVNVLIEGESGTGKEMVAKAIHFSSFRKEKPFYPINCGAIPKELLESELFGYKKGAFTGALTDRKGLFEEADGSTVFLDEINEMPLELQPKLLRVLQEKKIKRIGENREKTIDIRIICASSKNIYEEVKRENFRKDLFYRINVLNIKLPPLRERKEDIPLLINHFIIKYNKIIKKDIKGIKKNALRKCMSYSWPGNVRELENVIQRAMVLTSSDYIDENNIILDYENKLENIPSDIVNNMSYKEALKKYTMLIDKIYIKKALELSNYNKIEAARILGISVRTLHYKLKNLYKS